VFPFNPDEMAMACHGLPWSASGKSPIDPSVFCTSPSTHGHGQVDALPKLQGFLQKALEKCHDVDVALASVADQVAYYAVPAIQQPGLLHELHLKSIRDAKNAGTTTSRSRILRFAWWF